MSKLDKIRKRLLEDETLKGIHVTLQDQFKAAPEDMPEYLKTYDAFVDKVKPAEVQRPPEDTQEPEKK